MAPRPSDTWSDRVHPDGGQGDVPTIGQPAGGRARSHEYAVAHLFAQLVQGDRSELDLVGPCQRMPDQLDRLGTGRGGAR